METTAYYAFGVPFYFLLIAVEAWRARQAPRFADSFGNMTAGVGSIVIGLFLGPALLLLYDWAYTSFALVRWEGPGVWLVALVLADFGHYWHHRLDHRVAACWAVHGVHHMPEEMNFTVALRHAWFSDLYSFPFYAPLPLLGVPTSHFFVATTMLSVAALLTHTERFHFPSFGFLVTPRSHVLHHARNDPYVDRNFGAMLCVWDKLFGTHVERDPARPPRWGTHRGYATHDGALAQWVLWRDLLEVVRGARGLDKLRALLGRPGWAPAYVTVSPVVAPPASAAIPLRWKLYVAAQGLVTLAFSLVVFIGRDGLGDAFKLVAALAIIASMVTLGGILDGRPRARAFEVARVVACGALIATTL